MELGGGGSESAAKRARLSSGDVDSAAAAGEDRLSALPDDVLIFILLHLRTRAAARTSVLSRHWRRIWALLPELRFGEAIEPHQLRDALDAREAPVGYLLVQAHGATSESIGVWLPAAARRVSGVLTLLNYGPRYGAKKKGDEAAQRGAFELPCFEKATAIDLLLDFLGLAVPPAGVSTRLTRIYLRRVWFHGPGDLGHAVSSPRCPCLQRLDVDGARGLGGLSIHSESMLQLELKNVHALSQLTVVAPALKELTLEFCFAKSGPVANITAPLLANLVWNDVYDPRSVNLGKMELLRLLGTYSCFVYEYKHFMRNQSCVRFLQRFEGIETLLLTLVYPLDTEYYGQYYMMEDMADTSGHAFGASVLFHVLRLCTGIRRLMLQFVTSDSEAQTVCSWDCMCDQPADWETKELLLNHLKEVEIDGLRGSKDEFAFVKRVFNWVTKLKEMTVTFHFSTSEIKAKELYKVFQIFSRPGVCMKFYVYRNCSKVLYAPED